MQRRTYARDKEACLLGKPHARAHTWFRDAKKNGSWHRLAEGKRAWFRPGVLGSGWPVAWEVRPRLAKRSGSLLCGKAWDEISEPRGRQQPPDPGDHRLLTVLRGDGMCWQGGAAVPSSTEGLVCTDGAMHASVHDTHQPKTCNAGRRKAPGYLRGALWQCPQVLAASTTRDAPATAPSPRIGDRRPRPPRFAAQRPAPVRAPPRSAHRDKAAPHAQPPAVT
eukprot:gene8884-biopygen8021